MKRFTVSLIILLIIGCFLGEALAQQSIQAVSSGPFTSSQVIVARSARLVDVGVQTDGTAAVTVLIYDNASAASGEVIAFAFVPAGARIGGWDCPVPSYAAAGLYAAVSGTGVTRVLVSYDVQ